MFHQLDNVLTPQEVATLEAIAESTPFVDGRISNPHNTTKNNQQADMQHGGYRESAKLLTQALWRCEDFCTYAFPRRLLSPMLCRYKPGMNYGAHSDAAFIPVPPEPLRSDVSITIFLNEPAVPPCGSGDGRACASRAAAPAHIRVRGGRRGRMRGIHGETGAA